MPVVGYLSSLAQAVSVHFDAAFRRGLSEMGYVEGQNVSIEYRWITDSYDPLPTMAADLVQRQVAVICALGPPAVLAAKAATTSDSHRLCHRRRPDQIRLCRQLQPAGWKHHRHLDCHHGIGEKQTAAHA